MNAPPYYQAQYSAGPTGENASFPVIGGVLTLVGGIIGILSGCFLVIMYMAVFDGPMWIPDLMTAWISVYISIGIVFGSVGVIGGLFALRKKSWMLSLIGAVCAMISGMFIVIPLILGVVGLIFIALSKNQFQS